MRRGDRFAGWEMGTAQLQGEDAYKRLAGKTSEVHDRYNSLGMDLEQAGILAVKL
jgi:hypothetical protein